MATEKDARRDVSTFGFAKTFVLPALLIFLVPVLSFLFFLHAQGRYNDRAREAILADTVYSRNISPLLIRYGNYLGSLHQGGVTLPIFYFMLCFRALFELSLRRLGRQRGSRTDRIAVETTSPEAFSGAMLRIVTYSKYRKQIQQGFFERERPLETADIGRQVECGFPAYAMSFASNPELGSQKFLIRSTPTRPSLPDLPPSGRAPVPATRRRF